MPPPLPSLDQLRQQIDGIDDQLHDLLMRRAALVGDIRAAKPPGKSTVRPAREHAILKRLLDRHSGDLPPQTIVSIWREIIGAFASLQGADSVAGPAALEGLARSHYSSAMRYIVEDHPPSLLSRVSKGEAILGILPWPDDKEAWWVDVASMKERPFIIGSLPFLTHGTPQAVAFGMLDPEPTGENWSLVVYKARGEVPFAGIRPLAAKNGLRLIEVPSFIAPDDKKLMKTKGMTLLGSFGRPYIASITPPS